MFSFLCFSEAMAERDTNAGEPSKSSNPFLLPSSSTGGTQPSNVPSLFGAVTSNVSTASGNLFSGSAIGSSNPFGGAGMRNFDPGNYRSKEKSGFADGGFKPPPKLQEESVKSNQSVSSGYVFGGHSAGSGAAKVFSVSSDSKSFSTLPTGSLLPAQSSFEPKKVSSGFGELPGNKLVFGSSARENVDPVSSSNSSIFGGASNNDSSKSNKSDAPAVKSAFREGPLFQSAVSRQSASARLFVTSSGLSSSKHMLFGGSSSVSETKSVNSSGSKSVAPVFNVSSTNVSSQNSYSAAGVPSLFGGNSEKSKSFTKDAPPNVFGGASCNTACSTSVSSSSVPRLFGGVPSSSLATVKSSESNSSSQSSGSSVHTTPASALVFSSLPVSSATATVSSAPSSNTLFSNIFGGKTTDKPSNVTATTALPKFSAPDIIPKTESSSTFPVFGEPQKPKVTEQSVPSSVCSLDESSKTSVDLTVQTPPATTSSECMSDIEPGEIIDDEQENQLLFGGNQANQVNPTASLFGGKASHPEPGEKVEDNQENKSLFGNQESVTEPINMLVEKELKAILSEDLIDIFGKDEPKHPSSLPTSSDPPDKKELTKIIIAQIPDSCMNKDIIRNHFEKFGSVKRVYLNPKSNQATVQYGDHKGASRAKRKGQKIHPNLPEVKIFYGAPARRKSEESNSDAMLSKKKAIKTLQHMDSKVPSDLNPYTPLERPSDSQGPPSFLAKSQKELPGAGKSLGDSKGRHRKKDQVNLFKGLTERAASSKVSPVPLQKIRTSKPLSPKASPVPLDKFRNLKPLSPKGSPIPLQKIRTSKLISPRGSPIPLAKTEAFRTNRVGSPKHAQLKVEEERNKTSSRPVSPAREYLTFAESDSQKVPLDMETQSSLDRYNVLKARDKLMRNDRKKRLDINKATKLDATCPDMCPELERYMRDVQNDLSSYEVTNGILDHKLVIKKFSRSSADKEEPLPHELRPGPVLLKTMDFLVCNIVVLGDKKDIDIGIWYNYLWDRTRAIRSDITQQQLTDDIAVTIIERCVRFHVYTAVHLCEESPDVFDRKLNTENLTKSVQTLKELYKDLAEVGKFFQSESEFRAYEMLLNLNDGEKIVHQYSQYRDEVQKSHDVIFALKVFLALKSNNFVKFFKLIKSGTYLQGCILHRYFPQVRSKALDIFVKSYIVSKQVTIPLSYIIKNLGFEGKADATTYLNYHGIVVDNNDVMFIKNLFDLHPEGQVPVTRPMKLIESNRLFSVAEVIQGGPIPENPMHSYVPHDSFNGKGCLKPAARDASDQFKKLQSLLSRITQPLRDIGGEEPEVLPVTDQPSSDVVEVSDAPPPDQPTSGKVLYDHDYIEFIKDTYDTITTSVVSSLSTEIVKDVIAIVGKEQIQNAATKSVSREVLLECVKSEARFLAVEAYAEIDLEVKEIKRKEHEEAQRKLKALEEMRHNVSMSLCEEYMSAVINSMLKKLCSHSIREIEVRPQLGSSCRGDATH